MAPRSRLTGSARVRRLCWSVGRSVIGRFLKTVELARRLADRFTVINYDRRGRGDSGNADGYAVEREIEDLAAVIEAAGGSASLWGWSSGAVLALRGRCGVAGRAPGGL